MVGWVAHSGCSDPGRHAALVRALPAGAVAACDAARNVIGHYGTDFGELPAARRDEVNSRSLLRVLDIDQSRHPAPLDVPRDPLTRVAGCCRDHALFVVGVLREQGIPARTRVGFADYFVPGQRIDHVIAEYWSAGRWVRTDPELPAGSRPFDPADPALPAGSTAFDPADLETGAGAPFQTAAESWRECRRVGFEGYPIPPGSGFTDAGHLLRTYVALELAHLNGDELLLWDTWPGLDAFDDALADRVAESLAAADSGEGEGEGIAAAELTRLHARFGPRGVVTQLSPSGEPPRRVKIRMRSPRLF